MYVEEKCVEWFCRLSIQNECALIGAWKCFTSPPALLGNCDRPTDDGRSGHREVALPISVKKYKFIEEWVCGIISAKQVLTQTQKCSKMIL